MMVSFDDIILRLKSLDNPNILELATIENDIIKVLGWEDRFDLIDVTLTTPKVSFGNKDRTPPNFTESIYNVIPYVERLYGWTIIKPSPNVQLEKAAISTFPAVRMFNLDTKIDVTIVAASVELAFCAAWLSTEKIRRERARESPTL